MDVTRIIDLPSKTYIEEGDYIPIDNQQDGTQKVQFTNLFDSSLSQSDKIAPANAVGQQFTNTNAEINALRAAVGSPLKASTVAQMTDTNKIYVYTGSESGYTAGNWYYYNGTAWVSGGVYNSVAIETDKTLTVSNMAADAKVTGDEIADLKSDLNTTKDYLISSKAVAFKTLDNCGMYASGGTCVLTTLSGYKVAVIPIKKGVAYTFNSTKGKCTYGFGTGENSGAAVYNFTNDDLTDKIMVIESDYRFMYVQYQIENITNTLNVYERDFGASQLIDISKSVLHFTDTAIVANSSRLDYGKTFSTEGMNATDYIPVSGYSEIEITVVTVTETTDVGLVWYDQDKNPIGRKQYTWWITRGNYNARLAIPNGAAFVRTTYRADAEIYGEFSCSIVSTKGEYELLNGRKINSYKHAIQRNKYVINVAASDASDDVKLTADFVCDGVNDEVEIREAIDMITFNEGEIALSDGTFNIDSFELINSKYIALPLTRINGSTWSKTISGRAPRPSEYGRTVINITSTALTQLGDNIGYVFSTPEFTYGRIGNFKNFRLYLNDNQHKVTVIDNSVLSTGICENLVISGVAKAISNTEQTTMPAENCVGIVGFCGDDNGVYNMMNNCYCTGFYEGFRLGGEHLICNQLNARYNYYGYTFGNYDWHIGTQSHPITLINCCDEHSAKLPKFVRNGNYDSLDDQALQQIDMIGFNMEMFVPTNFGGGTLAPSIETVPDTFCGKIEFTAYGTSNSGETEEPIINNQKRVQFWADGSGHNFRTVNMTHKKGGTTSERESYTPTYMQEYFDTTLNKMLIYNGSAWVDMNGNVI